MFNHIGSAARWRQVVALALIAGVVAACHGGASDALGGGGLASANTKITLVAYSVPEPGWSKVIPAFNASPEGKGIQVITSYAASADQSRGVVEGKPADIVNFSVEPDITRLVKAGKVSGDWDKDATKGIPFGSVVTLVVRKGNPKNIRDWDDLLRPGVEVITPSPLSSGRPSGICSPRTPPRPAVAAIRKRASISSAGWCTSTSDYVPDRGASPPMSSPRAAATC